MLKYVGVLLTIQQICDLASKLTNQDLRDISDEGKLYCAISNIYGNAARFGIEGFPTAIPRGSNKEEDACTLFVQHRYENAHETLDNYVKVPIRKMDLPFLKWLVRTGMTQQQLRDQWTTLPDPLIEARAYGLIKDYYDPYAAPASRPRARKGMPKRRAQVGESKPEVEAGESKPEVEAGGSKPEVEAKDA